MKPSKMSQIVSGLGRRGLLNWMSDAAYLKLRYRASMGRKLNLKNPGTYTEKLQWLKLYNRNPQYSMLVDKYEVKDFVRQRIGEEYVIPTYGVWEHFDQIDFNALPEQFVLKCTHDSGSILICKDKSALDLEKTREKMDKALGRNFYPLNREWPYKNVKPRYIAEQYLEDRQIGELRDYKFYCFDGVPKMMLVASDRYTPGEETKFDFFDMDFQNLGIVNGGGISSKPVAKPQNFEKMKELVAKLSQGIPHVRVDFYEVEGALYFGEMTFFPYSGIVPFEPNSWDELMGTWLKLPEKRT